MLISVYQFKHNVKLRAIKKTRKERHNSNDWYVTTRFTNISERMLKLKYYRSRCARVSLSRCSITRHETCSCQEIKREIRTWAENVIRSRIFDAFSKYDRSSTVKSSWQITACETCIIARGYALSFITIHI